MKDQPQQEQPQCPILEKLDLLVKSTRNFAALANAAEGDSIISTLEKEIIVSKFETLQDQITAFYLLVNSKSCPVVKLQNLLNSTGNESATSILSKPKSISEREEWMRLKNIVADNIDRLSSHTMNLGLVLCFASGIGLITAKDRETIANCSTLEIDQLKQFYGTVSRKEEDSYDKFIKVLKMTNNNWALDVLDITD